MNRTFAVAGWTFLEARGRGEVLALLIVGVLCVALMGVLMLGNPAQMGEEKVDSPNGAGQTLSEGLPEKGDDIGSLVSRIMGSEQSFAVVSLFYSVFFVSFIAVLLSSNILKEDLESGVLASVLTKPVTRTQYLWGKYLGLNMVVLLAWGVLSVLLLGLAFASGPIGMDLPMVVLAEAVKLLVLTALIFRFSLRMPRVVAGFLGLAWYLAGTLSPIFANVAQSASTWYMRAVFRAVHVLLPPIGQLTYFGGRERIEPGAELISAPNSETFLLCSLWGLAWVVVLLWLAGRRFRRMEI